MASRKAAAAHESDIVEAIRAIAEDSCCETRITIRPGKGKDTLVVVAEVYRNDGVPIGIARHEGLCTPHGNRLLDVIQQALHITYWRATELATEGPGKVKRHMPAKR